MIKIACILPDASLMEQAVLAFQCPHEDIRIEVGLIDIDGQRTVIRRIDDAVIVVVGIADVAKEIAVAIGLVGVRD